MNHAHTDSDNINHIDSFRLSLGTLVCSVLQLVLVGIGINLITVQVYHE